MTGDPVLWLCHLIFRKLTVKLSAHLHIFVCLLTFECTQGAHSLDFIFKYSKWLLLIALISLCQSEA